MLSSKQKGKQEFYLLKKVSTPVQKEDCAEMVVKVRVLIGV